MSLFCLPAGPNSGGRGSESRQKTEELLLFCLPDTSKSTRAASKVEQNLQKLKKCSTAASKFSPRGLESRTKSSKIEKMFYSVTFAKAVWSQITRKFQKERFACNLSQVQWLSGCRAALHLAKSLLFTDKSAKIGSLSVNGPPENYRLRTKWSKTAVCP